MSTLAITILLAFAVVAIALVFLGIGWLLTGKPRIIRGACGMDPNKVRDERCGSDISCEVCKKPVKQDSENDEVH